jgi:D-aminopeptidase
MRPTKPRARDLGIPFDGIPAAWNAITDVPGVEVGHTTLISGEGELKPGDGPVRTGVTAILPRGKQSQAPVFAGWFSQNGNGEMTGAAWIDESGFVDGPIVITNTHSVGVVRDAVIAWRIRKKDIPVTTSGPGFFFSLPVVAETADLFLNDINGFHVKPEHVFHALESAEGGPALEGNVGGGTGMVSFGFKSGIGTSSRKLDESNGGYILGVMAQCNCGGRKQLRIAGAPVGIEMQDETLPVREMSSFTGDTGSIIIIISTDAPLLPHQLKRLARRGTMGLARTGSVSGNYSGDLLLAFSTANAEAGRRAGVAHLTMLSNNQMDPLFDATVQATEEAIINALVAAETMTGVNDRRVIAIPHERLRDVLRKYNRLIE